MGVHVDLETLGRQFDSDSLEVNDIILSEIKPDSSRLKKENGNKYPTASLR